MGSYVIQRLNDEQFSRRLVIDNRAIMTEHITFVRRSMTERYYIGSTSFDQTNIVTFGHKCPNFFLKIQRSKFSLSQAWILQVLLEFILQLRIDAVDRVSLLLSFQKQKGSPNRGGWRRWVRRVDSAIFGWFDWYVLQSFKTHIAADIWKGDVRF